MWPARVVSAWRLSRRETLLSKRRFLFLSLRGEAKRFWTLSGWERFRALASTRADEPCKAGTAPIYGRLNAGRRCVALGFGQNCPLCIRAGKRGRRNSCVLPVRKVVGVHRIGNAALFAGVAQW